MCKHIHAAVVFEQEELRLPNGEYRPDAPERLHEFWKKFGLVGEFAHGPLPNMLVVTSLLCIEDVS